MLVEVGNWIIEKAKDQQEDAKTIPIRMIANRLELDKENQEILPQAFSKATVDNFLQNGIIDWHHQSVAGKTPKERADAILGQPTDFKWEADGSNSRKLPVVYGRLTKSHPIVRDSILPHLEADQKVFAASVGGNVKKARNVVDKSTNRNKEQIMEINWDHLAIAASPYVISAGSAVSMCKAQVDGIEQREVLIKFSDISAFANEYDLILRGDDIRKALEVSGETDSAKLTGADALREQSLEGGKKKKKPSYKEMVESITKGLMDNSIGSSEQGVQIFLKSRGMDDDYISEFLGRLRKTVTTALS